MVVPTPYTDHLDELIPPPSIIFGVNGTTQEESELLRPDEGAVYQEHLDSARRLVVANRYEIELVRLTNQHAKEAAESEGLIVPKPAQTLDKSATFESLQYQRTKSALIRLAENFAVEAVSVGEAEGSIVDMMTVNAAVHFLSLLPTKCQLPKIAPDEDGIIMVWDTPQKATVITFVGFELHVVDDAGSTESLHIPPFQFDGINIPEEVVNCLPRRGGA